MKAADKRVNNGFYRQHKV